MREGTCPGGPFAPEVTQSAGCWSWVLCEGSRLTNLCCGSSSRVPSSWGRHLSLSYGLVSAWLWAQGALSSSLCAAAQWARSESSALWRVTQGRKSHGSFWPGQFIAPLHSWSHQHQSEQGPEQELKSMGMRGQLLMMIWLSNQLLLTL